MMTRLDPPRLVHAFDMVVELDPIMELGVGRAGKRRIIPVVGGRVEGERIRGEILDLGADWQTIFADGLAELDTRYALRTHDGAIIEIVNYGLRHGPPEVIARIAKGEPVDPSEYYMRTQCRLESGDARYQWVNRALFVGTGGRRSASVVISMYEIV